MKTTELLWCWVGMSGRNGTMVRGRKGWGSCDSFRWRWQSIFSPLATRKMAAGTLFLSLNSIKFSSVRLYWHGFLVKKHNTYKYNTYTQNNDITVPKQLVTECEKYLKSKKKRKKESYFWDKLCDVWWDHMTKSHKAYDVENNSSLPVL